MISVAGWLLAELAGVEVLAISEAVRLIVAGLVPLATEEAEQE
jgi:hypothetical protein